ncbi:MAG: extracellular solute-binding protein [Ruminococcaceae bacterium]|nr:extracellular solute-binding protein [Oscillospiraceae bacterium]
MNKRIVAICMLAALLLGMLGMVGCQPSVSTATPNFVVPEGGFDPTQEVTITFGHTMGQASMAIVDKYIKEFNKIYPNIKVEHVNKGGWSDINGTVTTEINGGTQPNIVYCYPDHVAMYNLAKAVVTLDNLIASQLPVGETGEILGLTEAQKNDIISSYYNEGTAFGDGLMYTMPFSKSTEILFYDVDFFKEHELKVPTTWEEMWDVCEQIKTIDPTCIPLGYDSADNWFITMTEQMKSGYTDASKTGGDRFTFNNDANKAFVEELRGYYEKGLFTTKDLYGNYTSGLFTNQDPSKARCYLCIGSSGGTRHQTPKTEDEEGNTTYAFEVGIAPIPQYDANNKKAISQGPSVCILKGNDTTDQQIMASWLFVKFLVTDVAFQAEFSMDSGYMPVLNSVTENATYKAWLDAANGFDKLNALAVKVGIEERDTYFVSDAFNGSSVARVQVGAMLNKIVSTELTGGMTVESLINSAFTDAIDECVFQAG